MKKYFLSIAAISSLTAWSNPEHKPVLEPSKVSKVFIPQGFDDNDAAQIVVTGYYQDSCHKEGPMEVKVDSENKTVNVTLQTYVYKGVFCLMWVMPYVRVVSLGVLNKGNYNVLVNGQLIASQKLPVVESKNPGPDDFLYAPVSSATQTRDRQIQLKGYFMDRCMKLKEVKILEEAGNVLVVLPIADYKPGCSNDTPKVIPWETSVDLSPNLAAGEYLLHVRSLNGQSLNQIINLQ